MQEGLPGGTDPEVKLRSTRIILSTDQRDNGSPKTHV